MTTPSAPKRPVSKRLTATVGVTAAAVLISVVPKFEGMVLRGYKDPIGIVTACAGHTKTAVLGKPYSLEQCETLLADDLADHAEGVLRCTPSLKDKPFQLAAASSFAFNNGVGAYCGSTIARRFRAGDIAGACRAFNESDSGKPQWVFVKDKRVQQPDGTWKWTYKTLPGLVTRRATERAICETKNQ